jgi:hypothetical protein
MKNIKSFDQYIKEEFGGMPGATKGEGGGSTLFKKASDAVGQFLGDKVFKNKADTFGRILDELLKDEAHLNKLLKIGAEKAEAVASKTLQDVYSRMGLISRG